MMRNRRLPPLAALGKTLFMAILCFGLTPALQAFAAKGLTVRPEKIEAFLGHKTAVSPLERDPFNWSREQINIFKGQEPRELSNSIGGLTLTGIIWDTNKPQAVINDRLVTKGETINNMVVREILKDLVIFEENGLSHELWLEASPRPLPVKDKKH
jgi:hypothetical protein